MRGDDRRPSGHSLQRRQAEALVEPGEDQCLRRGVDGRQVLVRHIAGGDDGIPHW